jgi:hypothetical protein
MEKIKHSTLRAGAKYTIRKCRIGETYDTKNYRAQKTLDGRIYITRLGKDGRAEMWFEVLKGKGAEIIDEEETE